MGIPIVRRKKEGKFYKEGCFLGFREILAFPPGGVPQSEIPLRIKCIAPRC